MMSAANQLRRMSTSPLGAQTDLTRPTSINIILTPPTEDDQLECLALEEYMLYDELHIMPVGPVRVSHICLQN